MGDQDDLHSQDVNIETIEELLAFRSLPAEFDASYSARIGRYLVVAEEGRTGNEWIDLPSFRIKRTREAAS
jgi:hypothetical protein